MGLFDWVPTMPDVIDWIDCRLTGHDWVRDEDDSVVVVCKNCGQRQ